MSTALYSIFLVLWLLANNRVIGKWPVDYNPKQLWRSLGCSLLKESSNRFETPNITCSPINPSCTVYIEELAVTWDFTSVPFSARTSLLVAESSLHVTPITDSGVTRTIEDETFTISCCDDFTATHASINYPGAIGKPTYIGFLCNSPAIVIPITASGTTYIETARCSFGSGSIGIDALTAVAFGTPEFPSPTPEPASMTTASSSSSTSTSK